MHRYICPNEQFKDCRWGDGAAITIPVLIADYSGTAEK